MKKRMICLLLVLCTLCLLAGSVYASSDTEKAENGQGVYVHDEAGLLTQMQAERLEKLAASAATQFEVGVYVITVEDYSTIHPEGVYEATASYYRKNGLGVGKEQNGIALLLSMAERDYALFCYGDKAQYAFTDYGLEKLEKEFLDNFAQDDWNGGFEDYLQECATYLAKAEAGEPVKGSPAGLIVIFMLISLLVAGAVCGVLKSQMKTVRKQTTASGYTVGGLVLTEQRDQFTHTTQARRRIENNTSQGQSKSESGSGGTGRSGKF